MANRRPAIGMQRLRVYPGDRSSRMLQLVITDERERKRELAVIPKTPEVISSNKIREYNVALPRQSRVGIMYSLGST